MTRPAMHLVDPQTGESDPADIRRVFESQLATSLAWRESTIAERIARLKKLRDAMLARRADFYAAFEKDYRKPAIEVDGTEFMPVLEEIRHTIGSLKKWAQPKRVRPTIGTLFTESWIEYQPRGRCLVVAPWNFPLAMITRKVAPALAAGCPVIIKPAELTPLTALAAAELAVRAGIPAGVINILSADSEQSIAIGKVLCASDVVRHISFTGSTEVGRILMAQSAPTVKKMSLELGGNAPFIVFDDADIDSAVEGAFASKYRNAGQTCVCTNRFYVQDGVYDQFVQKFAAKVRTAKVGNGFEEGVNQGPLIEEAALEKVQRHVEDAIAKGGQVLAGGQRLKTLGSGQFFEPTVVAHATPDMLCAREETFGPVVAIYKVASDAEAIARFKQMIERI